MTPLQALFEDPRFLNDLKLDPQHAFETLCGTCVDYLVRYALRMGVHENDARDVVQEVLMRLLVNLPKCPDPKPGFVIYWLSICVKEYRRRKMRQRDVSLETAGGLSVDGVLPLDPPCPKEVERAYQEKVLSDRDFLDSDDVQRALTEMDSELRTILELLDVQKLSQSKAAEAVGCCENTLRKRHGLAKRELCRLMLEQSRSKDR